MRRSLYIFILAILSLSFLLKGFSVKQGTGKATDLGLKTQNGFLRTIHFDQNQTDQVLYAYCPCGSINMAVDTSFSGTPERIHDGTDSSAWTASAESGSWDFASTDQAYSGTKSIDATALTDGDTAIIEDDVFSGDYIAFTGHIYMTRWVNDTDDWIFYSWDTTGNAMVGNSVNLNDYVSTGRLGEWQQFVVPKADMGLTTEEFNSVKFELSAGPNPNQTPRAYFDDIDIQEAGAPLVYRLRPPTGNAYVVDKIAIICANPNLSTTTPNGTMLGLDYSKFFGLTLTNGITYQVVRDGEVFIPVPIRSIFDFMLFPEQNISTAISWDNKTFIKFLLESNMKIVLRGDQDDYIDITVQDDLSSLDFLAFGTIGALMPLSDFDN